MSNANLRKVDAARQNPNVRMFLDIIAEAEGVKHGYNTLFGNTRFEDLSAHPGVRQSFTQTDGKKNVTTAAGRYQFLKPTWEGLERNLGISGMTPENQDRGAVELMREKGVLDDVMQGDFRGAAERLGETWASLPSSKAPQGKKTWDWFESTVHAHQRGMAPAALAARDPQVEPVASPSEQLMKNMAQFYAERSASKEAPSPFIPEPEIAGNKMPWVDMAQGLDSEVSQPDTAWNQELLNDTVEDELAFARKSAINKMTGREDSLPTLKLPSGITDAISKLINQTGLV